MPHARAIQIRGTLYALTVNTCLPLCAGRSSNQAKTWRMQTCAIPAS